jgi:hypothetical protein
MNQTAEKINEHEQPIGDATPGVEPETSTTSVEMPASGESPGIESAHTPADSASTEAQNDQNLEGSATTEVTATASDEAGGESKQSEESPMSAPSSETPTSDQGEAKKTRAPRTPKVAGKTAEAGGSITTIVERVVRMTALSDEHAAALGRLFSVSLPEDYVARLTRLTGASLGPIGSGASEALTIVLGLESANPIHVGVQLGRLAATSLPDVYRCAHALTGETAPPLPKGDNAVFAVADVLATLTTEDFALARTLSTALE